MSEESLAAAPFDRFRSPAVRPHGWQLTHFRSGTNEAVEIEATFEVGVPVGVAVQQLREGALQTLDRWGRMSRGLVFVDSGAFSEGKFSATGRYEVTRPIGHEEWLRRLELYLRIASAFGERAYLVAPDRVGSQTETLKRMTLYRAEVLSILARTGAQLIVPIQRGPWTSMAFARRAFDLYGRYRNMVWGLPLRKAATSPRDVATFAAGLAADATLPRRFHMLGLSPPFQRKQLLSPPAVLYFDVRAAIARELGDETPMTSDAVRLAALAVKGRPITEYQRAGLSRGEAIKRAYSEELTALKAWERDERT